jgi:DNA polymerase-3 subunit gamma/tau
MLSTTQYTTVPYNSSDKKVYILDEVHMISRHAMTALLKEFEKDLRNIQFILATTNIDKLPVAIISRALQIRLDSVSDNQIADNLRKVASKASYIIDEESISSIVYASHGSVRQSLSLLEQVALLSKQIDSKLTESVLGLASSDIISQIVEAFEKESMTDLFQILDNIKDLSNETIISQTLSEINKRILSKSASDTLISIGYELAEAAILIYNFPYSDNLLHITFGHALLKHKSEDAKEEKPRLSDLARKLFD